VIWRRSWKSDPAALALAERHYNRQRPGTPQFMPPGRTLVLVAEGAVWGSVAQSHGPNAGAWVCSIFRNEGAGLSSELVRDAVAATRAAWGEPPARGFLTYVNPGKLRRKRDPGRCFLRAGFELVGETEAAEEHGRDPLLVFRLAPERFPAPLVPLAMVGAPRAVLRAERRAR
jgi:hypothetical protein